MHGICDHGNHQDDVWVGVVNESSKEGVDGGEGGVEEEGGIEGAGAGMVEASGQQDPHD